MNVLFIGLGSIGQRHLKNVHAVALARGIDIVTDVVEPRALNYLDAATHALVRRQFATIAEIGHYDIIFVTNPSQLHHETLKEVQNKADVFFVEKPVFIKSLSPDALTLFADERRFYVACPIRHTRVYRFLSEFVPQNPVFCARAICSSYLPDWRPGQDYRKLYSASADSGGVKVDLIHEFDYLFALFGLPEKTHMVSRKLSNLEIACADNVSFIGEYADKTVELHLDYYGRSPQRFVELYTSDDVVQCDFLKSEVRFLRSGRVIDMHEERNDSCLREIEYFLDFALSGADNINSVVHANNVLAAIQ